MNCPKCGHAVVDMVGLLYHYNDTHRDTTAASYSLVVEAREANVKIAEESQQEPVAQDQQPIQDSVDANHQPVEHV
jgi:hypothetical protein